MPRRNISRKDLCDETVRMLPVFEKMMESSINKDKKFNDWIERNLKKLPPKKK